MDPVLISPPSNGNYWENVPLGKFIDYSYNLEEIKLSKSDTVLLMSDGMSEMFNKDGEMFGDRRTRSLFKESAGMSSKDVIQHLVTGMKNWADGMLQQDDVTFLVLRVK